MRARVHGPVCIRGRFASVHYVVITIFSTIPVLRNGHINVGFLRVQDSAEANEILLLLLLLLFIVRIRWGEWLCHAETVICMHEVSQPVQFKTGTAAIPL